MDTETIKPFLKSTIRMFKDMYNFTPTFGKAHIVTDLEHHSWNISGVIGIMGSYEGIFVIRLKKTTAFKLLKEATKVPETSKEIVETITAMIGEFANIICGNALNILTMDNVEITVPLTVQGTNHTISWPVKGHVIAIPFNTPYGQFELHINIVSS
ncbi:MAG: chemotaxis protein CheX [Spirochaetaceae bacterium]